jgi:aspartate carbamoyltransferase catalytic subunit
MTTLPSRHLLAIEGMHPPQIDALLDLAESYALLNRSGKTQRDLLRGRTLINLFFEDSTRTRTSFELAGKRLGADVINMSVSTSSVNKGETLLDTAGTLNAMHCDLLVVRHDQSAGAEGGRGGDQRRRRPARAPDPGAAGRADDPPAARPAGGADGGDLRRRAAQPGRP